MSELTVTAFNTHACAFVSKLWALQLLFWNHCVELMVAVRFDSTVSAREVIPAAIIPTATAIVARPRSPARIEIRFMFVFLVKAKTQGRWGAAQNDGPHW